MNKRFFLALVLTAIVIVATPLLFPNTGRQSTALNSSRDSLSKARIALSPRDSSTAAVVIPTITKIAPISKPDVAGSSAPVVDKDTTVVQAVRSTYGFSSVGGVPLSVVLDSYPSRRQVDNKRGAQLLEPNERLVRFKLISKQDTVSLDTISLHEQRTNPGAVTYSGDVAGHVVELQYHTDSDTADSYLLHVTAKVTNAGGISALRLELPYTLRSNEADTVDDVNHLAISYRPVRGEVASVAFSKLDSNEMRAEPGPINWVAARNKYFLVAFRAGTTPFTMLQLHGGPRSGKLAAYMKTSVTLSLDSLGRTSFDIYAGPQDFQRLQHLGGDLDQVNPYAGWLHPVVQPFATLVMRALLWMKHTTNLNYGWVLVLFGVIIRLVLWPLNQGAMRTSMKMQRLQPELQALQKKHSDDPKKQQEAIMRVYKEHGMSPLSPLMGCLPMLLPMPVLFALYYVFQNTIEFRGVPFLWLPDISLRDPFYITPLLMGVSMFVMSWIGMRNSPPNPQAKMMSYMMPVMLTVLFLNFASGLNLYYAVQNVAALPQQWLLARERGKTAGQGNSAPGSRSRA